MELQKLCSLCAAWLSKGFMMCVEALRRENCRDVAAYLRLRASAGACGVCAGLPHWQELANRGFVGRKHRNHLEKRAFQRPRRVSRRPFDV